MTKYVKIKTTKEVKNIHFLQSKYRQNIGFIDKMESKNNNKYIILQIKFIGIVFEETS